MTRKQTSPTRPCTPSLQVGIPNSADADFELVIEGVTGSYANGWIAMDDLYTYMGECTAQPPEATPEPLATTTSAPGKSWGCRTLLQAQVSLQAPANC